MQRGYNWGYSAVGDVSYLFDPFMKHNICISLQQRLPTSQSLSSEVHFCRLSICSSLFSFKAVFFSMQKHMKLNITALNSVLNSVTESEIDR